jgi:DNA-binding CsgD family transcriptional regulator
MESVDSELIDLIYAAMLGERPWEDFLDRLVATSPGAMSLMFALRGEPGSGPVSLLRGRGEDARADWDSHFASINPYVPGCMRKPLGRGVKGDRLVPRERLIGTEFFNDFMRENDLTATVGIAVDRSPGSTILISTATRLHDEAEQRLLADQYTRLAPHLRRAADFYKRNSHLGSVTELGGSLFGAIDVGVVLVSPEGKLRSISPTAEALLNGHLVFDRVGRVGFVMEEAQAVLKAMCSWRYDGPATVDVASPALRLSLVRIVQGGVVGLFDAGGVVILARRGAVDAKRAREALRRTYRLTRSEMRALDGIADGRSPAEIAATVDLSVETIRSQIKALYQKTGVNSRANLMRLLAGYDMRA